MRYFILTLLLITTNLLAQDIPEVVLQAKGDYEVWEGDQLEATITIPKEFEIVGRFELIEGLYLLDIKKQNQNTYDINIIVTDRDKINDVLLEVGERKFPVKVNGIKFKGDKITQGSYIFGQEINGNNKFLYLLIFFIFMFIVSGSIYLYRLQKQKKISAKIRKKKLAFIKVINDIKDKETYDQFYYQRFKIKKIFGGRAHLVDDFLKKSDQITFKDKLIEQDLELLKQEKTKLIQSLEDDGGV